jgi:hypothetical protein
MRLDRIQRHASRFDVKRPYHTFGYGAGANSWRLEKVTDAVGMETQFAYGTKAVSHNEGNEQYPNLSTTFFQMEDISNWPHPYISMQRQVGNFLYVCFQDETYPTADFGKVFKFENKGNYWQFIWSKNLVAIPDGWTPFIANLRVHLPEDASYLAITYYGKPPGDNTQEKNPILGIMDLTKAEPTYQWLKLYGGADHYTETFPFKDWIGVRCSAGGLRAYYNANGTWQEAEASGVHFFNDEWRNDAFIAGPGHLIAYAVPAPVHLNSQDYTEFAIAKVIDGKLCRKYWDFSSFYTFPGHAAYTPMGGWRILSVAATENFIAVAIDEMEGGTAAPGNCNANWKPNHNYSIAFFPVSELDLQGQTSNVQVSSLPNGGISGIRTNAMP